MNNQNKYLGKKKALEILGLSGMTLLKLEKENKIEIIKTIGGHRKYNVQKYIDDNKKESKLLNESSKNEEITTCVIKIIFGRDIY